MFKNILLAVDGSVYANRAALLAAEMTRYGKGSLTILTAYDPLPAYLGDPLLQNSINARMRDAEAIIEKTLTLLGDIGQPVQVEMLEGPPADAILKAAETRQADLIVMGSRGLGQLAGLLLGSQSQKVACHATCPVLIVR